MVTRFLDQLRPGGMGRVLGLSEDSLSSERLATLGFLPGRQVRLLRFAPMGDPVVFDLDGREVSLRRADARCVSIVPAESPDGSGR